MRKWSWLLIGTLLVAFFFRLYHLESREMWYDEAFAVLYAEKDPAAILYGTITPVEGAASDVHPLLYYLLLHFWMGLGQSSFVVRLPSVIFGLLAICLVFRTGQELFSTRAGVIAAALTTVSPFHIWYSQEARMYSLLCLASLLSIYFFVRAWKRDRWVYWLTFSIFTALSLYAHNLAFLVLLTLDLFVVMHRRWRLLGPLLISHIAIALLFLPWLLLVPGQFAKVRQVYWIPTPGPAELVRTLLVFTFNLPIPDWLLPFALFFSLLILFLTLYRTFRPRVVRKDGDNWAKYLAVSLAFVPVIAMFLISQIKAVYIERAMLVCALAYYVTIAQAILGSRLSRIVIAPLVPVPLLLIGSLWYQYNYSEFPRSPFREANAYLREHQSTGDVIVHDNKLSFFPSHYYDRDLDQQYVGDAPGSPSDTLALPTQEALGLLAQPDIAQATRGAPRVWFVAFQRALDEAQELGAPNPSKTWLDNEYRLTATKTFSDLNVYLYESP